MKKIFSFVLASLFVALMSGIPTFATGPAVTSDTSEEISIFMTGCKETGIGHEKTNEIETFVLNPDLNLLFSYTNAIYSAAHPVAPPNTAQASQYAQAFPEDADSFYKGNKEKIRWTLENGYGSQSGVDSLDNLKLLIGDTLTKEEAYAATQAALFHYTNGLTLSIGTDANQHPATGNIAKLYTLLTVGNESGAVAELNISMGISSASAVSMGDFYYYGPIPVRAAVIPSTLETSKTTYGKIFLDVTGASGITIYSKSGSVYNELPKDKKYGTATQTYYTDINTDIYLKIPKELMVSASPASVNTVTLTAMGKVSGLSEEKKDSAILVLQKTDGGQVWDTPQPVLGLFYLSVLDVYGRVGATFGISNPNGSSSGSSSGGSSSNQSSSKNSSSTINTSNNTTSSEKGDSNTIPVTENSVMLKGFLITAGLLGLSCIVLVKRRKKTTV